MGAGLAGHAQITGTRRRFLFDCSGSQPFNPGPFDLAGLVQLVLHLHARPHFCAGAKGLGQTVGLRHRAATGRPHQTNAPEPGRRWHGRPTPAMNKTGNAYRRIEPNSKVQLHQHCHISGKLGYHHEKHCSSTRSRCNQQHSIGSETRQGIHAPRRNICARAHEKQPRRVPPQQPELSIAWR
jgi:hypothetical protein